MTGLLRTVALCAIILLALTGCTLGTGDPIPKQVVQAPPTAPLSVLVKVELTVQADTPSPLNAVGQLIKYRYSIKITGSTTVSGNVVVTGATATCPAINTVGNKDNALDVSETLVCTSEHALTQADLDAGSVKSVTTASVNGLLSQPVTTTVQIPSLTLTKTANPATYDHAGQTITYQYVIKNSGSGNLGPTQFTISDSAMGGPLACTGPNTTLAPNATVTCTATYTIAPADMNAASLTHTATASGTGVGASPPASATITRGAVVQTNPNPNPNPVPLPNPNPGNLTAGSTVQHHVSAGEWLWQIARCYGADPQKTIQANPQLGNPAQISTDTIINVPNIGSVGTIYGPPCVLAYTVQSGDTWSSIAQKYNADSVVMQMVNSNGLAAGRVIDVPLNSAGGPRTSGGSSGTCVDMVRSLRFVDVPPGTTHFNVCGQRDADGDMKIGTISIRQRPEDVGLGGLSQDITVSPDTSSPVGDAKSLIVEDMNYDGYDDFRVVRTLPANPANIPYLYYIFDPNTGKFVYNQAYENITSPEFPGNSQIRSKWQINTNWGIDTYTVTNNAPRLTRQESWEAVNATQAKHLIKVFNADGTSQVTVDEVVPISAPPP